MPQLEKLEVRGFPVNRGTMEERDFRLDSEIEWATQKATLYHGHQLQASFDKADREARIHNEPMRAFYTLTLWHTQKAAKKPLLRPCTWCGHPTCVYCDYCSIEEQPVSLPVCSGCDEDLEYAMCRPCKESA